VKIKFNSHSNRNPLHFKILRAPRTKTVEQRLHSYIRPSRPTVFDICIMKYLNHLAPFSPENGNDFLSFKTLHFHVIQQQDSTCRLKRYVRGFYA